MRYVLLLCSLLVCFHNISNFPHHNDDTEIVMVEEIMRYTDGGQQNLTSTAALITLHDEQQAYNANADDDNESLMDTADDLIFLAKRPKTTAQKEHTPGETYHQIDLLTSDEEDSLTSASAERQQHDDDDDDDDAVDGVPREIELRTDDHAQHTNGHGIMHMPPLDMSDFVALIPAAEVKSIAANYYRNDAEVQRAYAFLSGREFAALKQHIIAIPEMSAFLRYLNNSGLDVVRFVYTLTNLTSKPVAGEKQQQQPQPLATIGSGDVVSGNEIEKIQYTTTTATTIATATKIAQATLESTTTKEQLNGLHGLVDSILDILPQDQILATFFDKLETNEQFSKLVDNIGSPVFAKILNNMENSVPLRNLIFSLHNNGIYITRIVDSLKAYFFLGTF